MQAGPLAAGLVASFVFGVLAIAVLLRFLRTRSTDVFVVYRVILAAVVLVVWLTSADRARPAGRRGTLGRWRS